MERSATRWRAVRRLLWIHGEPDPRVLQLWFVGLLALDSSLRWAGGAPHGPGAWTVRGAAVAVVLLVVVLLLPRDWRRSRLISVLAIADIAVIGMGMLNPADRGNGVLVVLPALWLGRQLLARGAVVAGAATFALVTVPGLVVHGAGGDALSRLVPLVVVAAVSAFSIATGLDVARAAMLRAERGERELARTLTMLETERLTSQAVFDAADVGLMLLDADGAIVGMNGRYEDIIRLSCPDDSVPWPGDTFAADGRTPITADELPSARAARGEEYDDYRLWSGADPSTRRASSVSARRIHDERGQTVGAALAATDITDLMRALDAKDEFVATVSHELRTPLTSIAGYVSILLEEDGLPDWVDSKLRIVDRNTKRLTALVEALLQEAHHVDGVLPLSPVEMDLAGAVAGRLEAVRPMACAGGVELEYAGGDRLVVVADPERIGQVIDNLISNAIKYTPRGGRVQVSLECRDAGAELCVADTGIGISPTDLDRLFTRFFRTRAAAEAAIQGVGLGLSITKAIVESHGGRIKAASQVGRGSEFRVWLPAVPRSTAAADPPTAGQYPAGIGVTTLTG